MVSIVIPSSSLVNIINAGLTVGFYKKENKKTKVYLINKEEKEIFWKNVKEYIDKEDGLLLILNYPLAPKEILKKIKLKPYKYPILYVPSKLITETSESKDLLFKKGIVSRPPREQYKCFPCKYPGETEKQWMEIGRLVSEDNKGEWISEETNQIIFGLIKTAKKDAYLAIDEIAGTLT